MKKTLLRNRSICALLLVFTLFASTSFVSIVKAGPASQIRVIPVGGSHTGEPIVTSSPAQLIIFSESQTPIEKVWLILTINEDTFNHLTSITAHSTPFAKSDFNEPTQDKIPPEAASGPYPGCQQGDRYEVSAIKDKLGTSGKVYYSYKAFSISTVTTTIQTFTLTVNAPGVTNMKVLVLANGYYAKLDEAGDNKLNEKTPYSGSTLVIPEPATLFIILASFAAFGLFEIKGARTSILRVHKK